MKCNEFLALLPQYPDDLPDNVTKAEMRAHAAGCESCAAELAAQEVMMEALHRMDEGVEVPRAFSDGWREAVVQATVEATVETPKAPPWKGLLASVAVVAVLLAGTSLMRGGLIFSEVNTAPSPAPLAMMETASRKSVVDDGAYVNGAGDGNYSMSAYDAPTSDEAEESGVQSGPVILYSATIDISSVQYDADRDRLLSLLEGNGGRVNYQSERGLPLSAESGTGRHAYYQLEVPQERYDDFVGAVKGIGTVTSSVQQADDITESYRDTEGRLASYTAQRDRLVELMESASDMEDIIAIEARLSEVQYSLEAMQGRVLSWDHRAANAEVTISITETKAVAEAGQQPGFWQRIGSALVASFVAVKDFLKDMVVFVVAAFPYLLVVAAVCLVVMVLVRAFRRRKY